jgi:hypothetical protein
MNNKAAFFDFHRDNNLEISSSEDAVVTDFTVVASCVVPDESDETKKREIKAEQVREYIAAEKTRPLSIKQRILNFIS